MTTTADLTAGAAVILPATLNSSGWTARVESVEPWILTAGPKAGTQATEGRGRNARPLFTVTLTKVMKVAESLRPMGEVDAAVDAQTVRHQAVTMDAPWTLA